MELGKLQEQFSRLHPRLIDKAWEIADKNGTTVRLGDLYRAPSIFGEFGEVKGYGSAFSCHKLKLAQDIHFIKGGAITDEGHKELHDWWDTVGGSKRIPQDMNHYSLLYQNKYR